MISKILIAFVLLSTFSYVHAESTSPNCHDVTVILDHLTLANCQMMANVVVMNFHGTPPTSPYATEFDKRNFVLAISKDVNALLKQAGIKTTKSGTSLISTTLVHPPYEDAILIRHVSKKKSAT